MTTTELNSSALQSAHEYDEVGPVLVQRPFGFFRYAFSLIPLRDGVQPDWSELSGFACAPLAFSYKAWDLMLIDEFERLFPDGSERPFVGQKVRVEVFGQMSCNDELTKEEFSLFGEQVLAVGDGVFIPRGFVPARELNPMAVSFVPAAVRYQVYGMDLTDHYRIHARVKECKSLEELEAVVAAIPTGAIDDYLLKRYVVTQEKHIRDGDNCRRLGKNKVPIGARGQGTVSYESPGKHKVKFQIGVQGDGAQFDHTVLRQNNFWRVPMTRITGATPPRPTVHTWSPNSGRFWILCQARDKLLANQKMMSRTKSRVAKRWCIMGNAAAEQMWKLPSSAHRSIVEAVCAGAEVFYEDMNELLSLVPTVPRLGDYLTKEQAALLEERYLDIGDERVTTVARLQDFAEAFKRHKPRFRAALEYLANGGDRARIQRDLDSCSAMVKPSRGPSKLRAEAPAFVPQAVRPSPVPVVEVRAPVLTGFADAVATGQKLKESLQIRKLREAARKESLPWEVRTFRVPQGGSFSKMSLFENGCASLAMNGGAFTMISASTPVDNEPSIRDIMGSLAKEVYDDVVAAVTMMVTQLNEAGCDCTAINFVASLSTYIFSLSQCEKWSQVMAATLQLLASFPRALEACSTALSRAIPQSGGLIEIGVEGIGLGIATALACLLFPQGDSLWSSIQERLGQLTVGMSKMANEYLLEGVVSVVKRVVLLFTDCVKQRSFLPLLGSETNVEDWMRRAQALLSFHKILIDGPTLPKTAEVAKLVENDLLPEDWVKRVHVDVWHRRCEMLLERSPGIAKLCSRDPMLRVSQQRLYNSLHELYDTWVNSHEVFSYRMMPFGVALVSPPGFGKTDLAETLMQSLLVSQKLPVDLYAWQPKTNFPSGFTESTTGVSFDDIDQNPPQNGSAELNHCEIYIRVNNILPFNIEAAIAEEKGKMGAKPYVSVCCTNFPDLRTRNFCAKPDAVFRRFPWYVELEIKPEYRVAGGDMLDGSKTGGVEEYWNFIVKRYTNAPGDIPYREVYRTGSRSELLKYFRKRFAEHLDMQRKTLARKQAKDLCPDCGAPFTKFSWCSCMEALNKQIVVAQGTGIQSNTNVNFSLVSVPTGSQLLSDGGAWFSWPRVLAVAAGLGSFWLTYAYGAQIPGIIGDQCLVVLRTCASPFLSTWANLLLVKRRIGALFSFRPARWALVMCGALFTALAAYRFSKTISQGRQGNVPDPEVIKRDWTRVPQDYVMGMPGYSAATTWTKDELIENIKRSTAEVKGRRYVWGVWISRDCLLVPFHTVGDHEKGTLDEGRDVEVKYAGVTCTFKVSAMTVARLGYQDLAVCRVMNCVHVIPLKKFWLDQDNDVGKFDEFELVGVEKHLVATKNVIGGGKGADVWKSDVDTVDGDCGMIYVAQNKTRAGQWRAVAMHVARDHSLLGGWGMAIGSVCRGRQLEQAVASLCGTMQDTAIPQGILPDNCTWSEFPKKSEVWTARSQRGIEVQAHGTIHPPVSHMTMKTRVMRTIFADDFADLEKDWCGETPYWHPPNFKGKMVEDKWSSSWISALLPVSRKGADMRYVYLALYDYLSGFHGMDVSGWRPLSQAETITGIPGSNIGSVNMKTSVGPPLGGPKSSHIAIVDGEPHVSPALGRIWNNIEEIVAQGRIAIPLFVWTLKDEPVTAKKNEEHKIRVFNNGSAAYNLFMKADAGVVNAFLRSVPFTSECMVGINMTSAEATNVVARLKTVDPSLTRIVEGDISKQDKGMTGERLAMVELAYYALAWLIGVRAVRALSAIAGLRHCMHCLNNDVFTEGASNPSGNDATVQINSIDNSLAARYAYYRMKYPNGLPPELHLRVRRWMHTFWSDPIPQPTPQLTFREHCALATYGDDSLNAISKHCWFFELDRLTELYAELNLQLTDGQKRGRVQFCTIEEMTFLKRHFRWDEELGVFLTPISLKTIAKMLVIHGDSTLSELDHGAAVLNDVLREMVYHGEEKFEYMRGRILHVADKYGFADSPYFKCPTYSFYRGQLASGSFQTWSSHTASDWEQSITSFLDVADN